jgi:hypothetical protein
MANRRIVVEFLGDDKSLGRTFASTDKAASGWSKKLGGLKAKAGLAFAAVGAGAVSMGLDFVRAAEESGKVTAQTAAVIKSMGGVAGVSADQVAKLSEQLSLKTGVDDELIQSGQNVLLTFGQIRNEAGKGPKVFDRATQAALDMSVALGQDMTSASMTVGKALNDPIRGLTTLRRSGVQFTAQQEDQIRAMVEAGDVAGAQGLILDELGRQFGGSAEAQATASGKLSTAWGNLQETLGEKLLPLVNKLSEWAIAHQPLLVGLAVVVGGALTAAFIAWGVALLAPIAPFVAIGAAVAGLAALVVVHFDTIKAAVAGAFNWVKTNWPLLLAILTGPVGLAVLAITRHWGTIKAGATAVKDWIVARLGDVVGFITGLPGRVGRAVAGMFDGIPDAFRGAINSLIGMWNRLRIPGFSIHQKLPGPIPDINFSWSGISLPDIPFLAQGGIIPATPGGRLLVAGEAGVDEAVVPLDGRHRAGGDIYVTVNVDRPIVADKREFTHMVAEAATRAFEQGRIKPFGRRIGP